MDEHPLDSIIEKWVKHDLKWHGLQIRNLMMVKQKLPNIPLTTTPFNFELWLNAKMKKP